MFDVIMKEMQILWILGAIGIIATFNALDSNIDFAFPIDRLEKNKKNESSNKFSSIRKRIRGILWYPSTILSWCIIGGIVAGYVFTAPCEHADICTCEIMQIDYGDLTSVVYALMWFFLVALVGGLMNGSWFIFSKSKPTKMLVIISLILYVFSGLWFNNLFIKYQTNIEITTENVEHVQEYELAIFRDVPIQHVSGDLSGSKHHFSGELQTSDMIPYAYVLENGNLKYNSVETNISEIVPLKEGDGAAKVQVKSITTKTFRINHNEGTTEEIGSKQTVIYYFYVPEAVIYTISDEA